MSQSNMFKTTMEPIESLCGIRPRDTAKPIVPVADAGSQIDPPPSNPIAITANPIATATADPLELHPE